MPNHKSAEKRDRQNEKKRLVNRSNRAKLRTQIKKLRTAIAGHDKSGGTELLNPTVSLIDKMVNKGILHKNAAARHKARLTSHVNNL
jgi:small subunit ribosomal protein S20